MDAVRAVAAGRGPYADRFEAGRVLADAVADRFGSVADAVVLALPRGGVPVAVPIAERLRAPLDLVVVRKLGHPAQPELAVGAIAGLAGTIDVVRNARAIRRGEVSESTFARLLDSEVAELRRRQHELRGDRPPIEVRGRTVVLVDDGLATGSTMRAAIASIRRAEPAQTIVAVPIGAPETCADLAADVDALICPWRPGRFAAVGQGYRDFTQVSDESVRRLLDR